MPHSLAVSLPGTGCLYEWVALDQYAYDRGYATNLIRIEGTGPSWKLQLPAMGAELHRI